MGDTSDPADIRPRLRTLEQIRDEALAKREKLARDMIAASSGPRGGSGSRGAQIDSKAKGLAWVQGGIDADYMLPKLHPLFAESLLHCVANVPPWRGEPKTDVEALEALDALLTALTVAMKHDSTATAESGGGQCGEQLVEGEMGVLAIAPGGFVLRGKHHRLTGRPLEMLRVLLTCRHHSATADHLRQQMKVNDESVSYPDQVILDTATSLRKVLKKAAAKVGLACPKNNPLPSIGKGKDLTYSLASELFSIDSK